MAYRVGSPQDCKEIGHVTSTECALARCWADVLRLDIGPNHSTAGEKYAHNFMSWSDDSDQLA